MFVRGVGGGWGGGWVRHTYSGVGFRERGGGGGRSVGAAMVSYLSRLNLLVEVMGAMNRSVT